MTEGYYLSLNELWGSDHRGAGWRSRLGVGEGARELETMERSLPWK